MRSHSMHCRSPLISKPGPLLLAALLSTVLQAQDQVTVYQNARILPAGRAPIDNGVLITARGKVQAVGTAATPIPEGAVRVDCSGKTITPGLVDAAWNRGFAVVPGQINDANEQGDEVTPHMKVLDGLDPGDKAFVRARAAGVTAVHLLPGTRNVMGGLSAVLKTDGPEPAAMLLRDESGLRIVMGAEPSQGNRAIRGGNVDSMYYRRPTTRMGVVWAVRKAFYDAKAAAERTIADGGEPKSDPATSVLLRALSRELTVYTTARAEQDIRTALRLAAEFGYTTVIDDAQDAHFVVDELAAANVWVLLGAPSATAVAGSAGADGAEPRLSTVVQLAQRGIRFAITTGSNAQALDLVREAMFAVRNGLSPTQALDAVTIQPARLLGVDDRIGSLEPGKDADFVLWSADPFDPTAVATAVYVNGLPASLNR